MSSPTRRPRSASVGHEPEPQQHDSLSRASSTNSDIFFETTEENGLLPILQNIQYCLHKSLTNSNNVQLKQADRILKADCNKALKNAMKNERTLMGNQIVNFLNGSPLKPQIPQCIKFDDSQLACSDHDFEQHLKSIQRQYPRYNAKSSELLYFIMDVCELREALNFTDKQLARLVSNRLTDRLLSYFMTEIKREPITDVINKIALTYVKVIDPLEEVDRYFSFKFRFNNLLDELVELRETMSLAHPRKSNELIDQLFIERVLSLLPIVQRHALISDLNHRDEMVHLGVVTAPYSQHELIQRILYHCKDLNKFSNQRPQVIHKLEDDKKESDNDKITSCLEHIVKEMKKFHDFVDSFPKNNTPPNRVSRDKSIIVDANSEQYRRFVEQIKQDQFFKFIGQKIASDIKETEPQFREVLRLIRSDKPQGNPYNWDDDGNYIIDPSYIMDFPMFRVINGRTPQFTKEALKAFSERCYCCGMPECAGKNSPDCIYHGKPDSWFPCQNCRSGFHNREDCKAVFIDE